MAITEEYDDLFDRVRGNLGEHFSNYMFIVMDDDGDLFYDYSNPRVGRCLFGRHLRIWLVNLALTSSGKK